MKVNRQKREIVVDLVILRHLQLLGGSLTLPVMMMTAHCYISERRRLLVCPEETTLETSKLTNDRMILRLWKVRLLIWSYVSKI